MSVGAIANIAINYFLISVLGIEGASLVTLMGYAVSDVICVIVLCKMNLMVLEKKFIFATLGMGLFFVSWRFLFPSNPVLGLALSVLFCLYCLLLYINEIKKILMIMRK